MGNLLTNDFANPVPNVRDLNKEVIIECTQVVLEYKAGSRVKNTKSDNCA